MLPLLRDGWRSALLPLAALVLAGWMLHRFIRWAIQATEWSRSWRASHTVAGMALLLLGYAAAITLLGIAHQSTWLLGERWISSGYPLQQAAYSAKAHAVFLLDAVEDFHRTHGHYPDSLRELKVPAGRLLVETGYGGILEPMIYLKPGGHPQADDNEPVIISPMVGSHWVVVGSTSKNVRLINWEELETVRQPADPAYPHNAPSSHE